jgi:hypothetical protein
MEVNMTKGNRVILHLVTSLLAFVLLNFSGHAAPMAYCLWYGNGGSDCGFASRAQCEASASGQTAQCSPNELGHGRNDQALSRSTYHQRPH